MVMNRSKLPEFYEKMKRLEEENSQKSSDPDPFGGFVGRGGRMMGEKAESKAVTRVFSAPFRSEFGADVELQAAVSKLFLDAICRFSQSF